MKMVIRTIAGLGLVAAFASVGQAQFLTDAGSPLGGGGGLTGSVASFVPPAGSATGVGRDISLGRAALIAVLNGGSTAALATTLGGTPQATALAQAFGALGAQQTSQTFIAAIQAWNAFVTAGGPPNNSTANFQAAVAKDFLLAIGAVPQR